MFIAFKYLKGFIYFYLQFYYISIKRKINFWNILGNFGLI